ncbi:MAG: hypothetical protein AAFO94_15870 [Bacteroidota bacterium]
MTTWQPFIDRLDSMKPWAHLLSALLAIVGIVIITKSNLSVLNEWLGIAAVVVFAVILAVVNEIGLSKFAGILFRVLVRRQIQDRSDRIMFGLLVVISTPFIFFSPLISGLGGSLGPERFANDATQLSSDSLHLAYQVKADQLASSTATLLQEKETRFGESRKAKEKHFDQLRQVQYSYYNRHKALYQKDPETYKWAYGHMEKATAEVTRLNADEAKELSELSDSLSQTSEELQQRQLQKMDKLDAALELQLAQLDSTNLQLRTEHESMITLSGNVLAPIGIFISIFLIMYYLSIEIFKYKAGIEEPAPKEKLPGWWSIIWDGIGGKIRLKRRIIAKVFPSQKPTARTLATTASVPTATVPIQRKGTKSPSNRPQKPSQPSKPSTQIVTVVKTKTRRYTHCLQCQTDIREMKRNAKFCGDACRKKYNRRKHT